MFKQKFIKQFCVKPGSKVDLKKFRTDWADTKEAKQFGEAKFKKRALKTLEHNREQLDAVQELIYASNTHSVLLIFQAMDAAGKDGTIRHVMSGVNPQGCQVFSFKKPSAEELDHNFLWRYMKSLPERGRIGIFNRSYYEDVLVVKVHPEWLDQKLPEKPGKKFWEARYDDINNFEKHLVCNGTLVLKFFLHLSKKEQKNRFMERLTNSEKYWKFSAADMPERGFWKEYQQAFEEAFTATSTKWAPWYVIPADRKYVARALVADIIVSAIAGLRLKFPEVSKEQVKALAAARRELEAEGKKPAGQKAQPQPKTTPKPRSKPRVKVLLKPPSTPKPRPSAPPQGSPGLADTATLAVASAGDQSQTGGPQQTPRPRR
jgi:PPK2 family polyphosphate:nucleotide phosphotransferase